MSDDFVQEVEIEVVSSSSWPTISPRDRWQCYIWISLAIAAVVISRARSPIRSNGLQLLTLTEGACRPPSKFDGCETTADETITKQRESWSAQSSACLRLEDVRLLRDGAQCKNTCCLGLSRVNKLCCCCCCVAVAVCIGGDSTN